MLIVTPRGVLWFGSPESLDSAVLDAVADNPEAEQMVLNLSGLGHIDTTGAIVLHSVLKNARAGGISATVHGVPHRLGYSSTVCLASKRTRSGNRSGGQDG